MAEFETNTFKDEPAAMLTRYKRGKILLEALRIINGERQQVYGQPEDCFQDIADQWNWYLKDNLKQPLTPRNVAYMQAQLKFAREKNGTGDRDNIRDACGYLAIYDDMGLLK